VRSVYMESCGMFVRGGVTGGAGQHGSVLAKASVSSLIFDYILTGPISVVSAGQYIGRCSTKSWSCCTRPMHSGEHIPAGFAVLVTIYFWWQNIKGVHESSGKTLRIMQIHTVMVAILLVWCPLTIVLKDRGKLFRRRRCPAI